MHIICMHMAMAVMRSAFNIVSCFYRKPGCFVKGERWKYRPTGVLCRIADDPVGEIAMKIGWIPCLRCWKIWCISALLCLTTSAFALSAEMERATVHGMRKVPCMEAQLAGGGEILSVSAVTETGPVAAECTEYELRTGRVSYIIHPRRAILLEVGGEVAIRLAGKQLMLRTSSDVKEIRCDVLSMTLRSEEEKKEKDKEWERQHQPIRQYPSGCYTDSGIEFSCGEDEASR
jgi:hypothetical protein